MPETPDDPGHGSRAAAAERRRARFAPAKDKARTGKVVIPMRIGLAITAVLVPKAVVRAMALAGRHPVHALHQAADVLRGMPRLTIVGRGAPIRPGWTSP